MRNCVELKKSNDFETKQNKTKKSRKQFGTKFEIVTIKNALFQNTKLTKLFV